MGNAVQCNACNDVHTLFIHKRYTYTKCIIDSWIEREMILATLLVLYDM